MMMRARWRVSIGATLVTYAGLAGAAAEKPLTHRADDEAREVAFLVAKGSADSLATASLLAHLVESDAKPDSTALIQRAAALAPRRPEILWLLLRDCQLRHCAEESALAQRLRDVDPGNALGLLPALNASRAGPPTETTRIIAEMGASKTLTLYWNKTLVMMFDAMTHSGPGTPATAITHEADDRLTHAAGVLAAIDVPPFKPITFVCASDQFQEAGRREACEKLMTRLDAADSIIAQSLSTSVQLKWWQPGTPQAAALQGARLQQEYLVQASARVRDGRVNADAQLRVDAMRRAATEEAADKAVLTAFREPVERPAEWHSPGAADGR
jgi:hypothetical protein